MRRLAPFLLALLLAPAVAWGQPSPYQPGPARPAILTVDARDYGVDPAKSDNVAELRNWIAACKKLAEAQATNGRSPIVRAFLPAGDYATSGRINLSSFIRLTGEGTGSRIVVNPPYAITPVTIGVDIDGLAAKYRPDLWNGGAPKLDSSAVSGPNQRRSIATCTDGWLSFPAGQFSHGGYYSVPEWDRADCWTRTRQLTIEAALEGTNGGPMPAGAAVFNVGDYAGSSDGTYFLRMDGPNLYCFGISTQGAPHEDWTAKSLQYYRFSTGNAVGVQRVAICLDLDAGKVRAYANGVQVDVQPFSTTTWPDPKRSLYENRYHVFSLNNGGSMPSGPRFDWSLHGLLMRRSCPYADDGAGKPQRRGNGGAINDAYRYFPQMPGPDVQDVIGYLPLDEPDPTIRDITVIGGMQGVGAWRTAGYFLTPGMAGASLNHVDNIEIRGNRGYGFGVMMGSVLQTRFRDMSARGGMVGVGNMPWGACYRTFLENCNLAGRDCGFFGYMNIIVADRTDFLNQGRAAWRLVACDIVDRDSFVFNGGQPQYAYMMVHAGDYGHSIRTEGATVDFEGDTYEVGGVVVERSWHGQMLVARRLNFGTGTMSVPMFKLKDTVPGAEGDAVIDAEFCSTGGPVLVEAAGPWGGSVRLSTSAAPAGKAAVVGPAAANVTADLPAFLRANPAAAKRAIRRKADNAKDLR